MKNTLVSLLLLCLASAAQAQLTPWTWIAGTDSIESIGVYGTKGVADTANVPPSRAYHASWVDLQGHIWVFGGIHHTWGNQQYNDLWKYDPASDLWTWMHGSNQTATSGSYGTKNVSDSSNAPGARYSPATWTDTAGNLWLFGGQGLDADSASGRLNDLWKYDIDSNHWTWVSGSDSVDMLTVHGTLNAAADSNMPGGRDGAVGMLGDSNELYLYGGSGYSAYTNLGFLNDVWKYDISTGQWTWIHGTITWNNPGAYVAIDTLSVYSRPRARQSAASWKDANGDLWIYGGFGSVSGANRFLNDLWKFDLDQGLWIWKGGTNQGNQNITFGSIGTAAPGVNPGGVALACHWIDSIGNFWLFGGRGYPYNQNNLTVYSTLWYFNPDTELWTWMNGDYSGYANYGIKGVTASSNRIKRRRAGTGAYVNGTAYVFGGDGNGFLNDMWSTDIDTCLLPSAPGVLYGSTTHICQGDSAVLFVTHQGSITWYDAATGGNLLHTGDTFNAGPFYSDTTLYVQDSTSCGVGERNAVDIHVYNPEIQLSIDHVSCYGGSDGHVIANSINTWGSTFYQWSIGGGGTQKGNHTAGAYYVVGNFSPGCSDTAWYQITQPDTALYIDSSTIINIFCNGDASGSVSVVASGGTPAYAFQWNSGNNSSSISGLTADNYSVTVSDANSCTVTQTFTLLQPTAIQLNPSIGAVSCYGFSDGWINLSPSGGYGGYGYAWASGHTNALKDSLSQGNYHVTVTDVLGCTESDQFIVGQPDDIQLVFDSVQHPSCFGLSDGLLHVSISGGNGLWSLQWNNGDTITDISSLPAGTYVVSVADSLGCAASDSIELIGPDLLVVNLQSQPEILCFGDSTGQLSAQASGGNAPYAFTWNTGSNQATSLNHWSGTYYLTVSDDHACTTEDSITVYEASSSLSVEADSIQNVPCYAVGNGMIALSANGGIAPYTYSWSNGASSSVVIDLDTGYYAVWVTDSIGCMDSAYFSIVETAPIQLAIDGSNALCYAGSSGTATASMTGYGSTFNMVWNTGATNDTLSALTAGTYTLTVTNEFGCAATDSIVISQPAALHVQFDANAPSCFGFTNGQILSTSFGGTMPYTYQWSTSETTQSLSGLDSGLYALTVTDANGCSDSGAVGLTMPTPLTLSLTSSTLHCSYDSNAYLLVSASGGVLPYTMAWSTGQNSVMVDSVGSGTYSVTVMDSNDCLASDSVTLIAQSHVYLTADSLSDASCHNAANAFVSVLAFDGVAPYSYAWSNNIGNFAGQNVLAGTYTVTVTDSVGCMDSLELTISQPDSILVNPTVLANALCYGYFGAVSACPTGGNGIYEYNWTGNVFVPNNADSMILAGTHYITVRDSNGCMGTDSLTLTQPDSLTLSFDYADEICLGDSNGFAKVTPSGGTLPYAYAWNDAQNQTTQTISGLGAGIYVVTITDSNGCALIDSVVIDPGASLPIPNLGADTLAGTGPFTLYPGAFSSYYWQDASNLDSLIATTEGTYWVAVSDSLGCVGTDTVVVIIWPTGISNAPGDRHMSVFPNPTQGWTTVQASTSFQGEVRLEIRNAQGQMVRSACAPAAGNVVELDLQALARGTYFLHVQDDLGQRLFRIVLM